jgi:ABC-type transporter Mla maintaining outer membrane lipid asymmetry ATPase subunit MlaF
MMLETFSPFQLEAAGLVNEQGHELLEPTSLVIDKPGCYRISSQAGAGLSQVLRLMAGLVHPTTGSVRWGAKKVDEERFHRNAKDRLAFSYVQRTGGLLANHSILSNTILPLIYHGWFSESQALELGKSYLEELGFIDEKDKLPAWSSDKACKLGLVLRSLIACPQYLILDDPFYGLNPEAADSLLSSIERHRAEKGLRVIILGTDDSRWDAALKIKKIRLQNARFELLFGNGKGE